MPTNSSIEICPADPSWATAFALIADELAAELRHDVRIEHIGSTAVSGLAAKPVIDVLVGVARADNVVIAAESLLRLGFAPGEASGLSVPSAFFARPSRGVTPPINLHLTLAGSRQWDDLIRFRAALQGDPALAVRYEALKRRLAAASGGDLDAYTAGKTAFVAAVLEAAHG
ncbi:GrpB family protein [Phenylobacterium sp.]|uniref:GrpB family protein n=1 Tax=Phenylobacterium sp. TaxID=1871053 RepID=UPI0035C7F784